MTTGEMKGFTDRFKNIIKSSAPGAIKNKRLSAMMTDLEVAYGIPMLRNEKFGKQNPHLMQLYRTVSDARSL